MKYNLKHNNKKAFVSLNIREVIKACRNSLIAQMRNGLEKDGFKLTDEEPEFIITSKSVVIAYPMQGEQNEIQTHH